MAELEFKPKSFQHQDTTVLTTLLMCPDGIIKSPDGIILHPFLVTYENFALIFPRFLTPLHPIPNFLALIHLETFYKL